MTKAISFDAVIFDMDGTLLDTELVFRTVVFDVATELGYEMTNALHLAMSRGDIANYLRLAAETVSRVLRRFQDHGLILVEGRDVAIAKPAELFALARPILQR